MTSDCDPTVQIRDLWFGWTKHHILRGVDLTVHAGEAVALVGDNGAGKSTLLQLVAAIEPYRRLLSRRKGSLRVLGCDAVRRANHIRSHVAFVHDRLELPRWMRIADHARLTAALHPTWDTGIVQRWLGEFGLEPRLRIDDLSKGQRALARIAVALGLRSRLLILDEPFDGLDAPSRRAVQRALIEELAREAAPAVLLTSHSFADIERCADRIAWLRDGRTDEVASVDEWRARTSSGALEDGPWATATQGVAA